MKLHSLINKLADLQLQRVMDNCMNTDVVIGIDKDGVIGREQIASISLDAQGNVVLSNKV